MSEDRIEYFSVSTNSVLRFSCENPQKGSDCQTLQVRHSQLNGAENRENIVSFVRSLFSGRIKRLADEIPNFDLRLLAAKAVHSEMILSNYQDRLLDIHSRNFDSIFQYQDSDFDKMEGIIANLFVLNAKAGNDRFGLSFSDLFISLHYKWEEIVNVVSFLDTKRRLLTSLGDDRYHISTSQGAIKDLEEIAKKANSILVENADVQKVNQGDSEMFVSRNYHQHIIQHAQTLFLQGHYSNAVSEVAKAYNKLVKEKAHSDKDGRSLMLDVWRGDNGVLKITECQTESDMNFQEGVGFFSAGLIQAVRNPTAHEPAIDWEITKNDCLDILSAFTFLFRLLDVAVLKMEST